MRRFASILAVGIAVAAWASTSVADAPSRSRADWSASPLPLDDAQLDDVERDAMGRCGRGEAGLGVVARALLERKRHGGSLPDLDGLAGALRDAGEPHPWPKAWSARGSSRAAMLAAFDAWLGTGAVPRRRCGVAHGVDPGGTETLVAVAVEAFADLAPLPARARTGQWLTLEAHLRVPASRTSVVVMEADGLPRTVPSWVEGNTVRARFAPDRPGELDVQVVADVAGGPRPVVEAEVAVDVSDDVARSPDLPAPGERAGDGEGLADADRLARMIGAARGALGLSALPSDPRLDAVARAHAERMAATGELAHDAGDGDPFERIRAAGLEPRSAGENVAHAPSLALAHRALWASPSHRLNVLGRGFDRMGLGIVRAAGGDFWVVELFAGGLEGR